MRKLIIFIVWLLLFLSQVYSYQVTVGEGNDPSQHLPCDPYYSHSGSQLIYASNYYPYCGTITQISFQYQFITSNPQDFLNNITVMMGESSLDSYQDEDSFINPDILEVCFSGDLTAQNFQASNTDGAGWLNITLDQPYYYTKTGNLILFFLENETGIGLNGDDFIASETAHNTSMCFIDFDNPIDIDNLGNPMFVRNRLPNTVFEMTIDENYPQAVSPQDNSEDVDVTTPFQFQVLDTNDAEIKLFSNINEITIPIHQDLQPISGDIYELSPELPLEPNCQYDWQVAYVSNGTTYLSEMLSFETDAEEDLLEITSCEIANYSVFLEWDSLYNNQFPYSIYRNEELLSSQFENSFTDTQVSLGETYQYQVKFYYLDESFVESDILTVELVELENDLFNEEFESYPSFQENLGAWQNIDNDGGSSYSLPGYEYPNQGTESGFLVFEPGAIIPPLDLGISSEKCLVSFASSVPPTSDLLISPPFQAYQVEVDIYLKSYDISWGMERVKCGLLFNNEPENVFYFQDGDYLEIPAEMTHLHFVHEVAAEDIITNFTLESCGIQTLMLIIDRIVISSTATNNDDSEVESVSDVLIFPNPITKGSFEIDNQRANSDVKIYNLKGQLVYQTKTDSKKQKINLPNRLTSGIYLLKVRSGEEDILRKISILK